LPSKKTPPFSTSVKSFQFANWFFMYTLPILFSFRMMAWLFDKIYCYIFLLTPTNPIRPMPRSNIVAIGAINYFFSSGAFAFSSQIILPNCESGATGSIMITWAVLRYIRSGPCNSFPRLTRTP
jgi:hypothetical protein